MLRPAVLLMLVPLALAGCGGRDSSLNPMRWFGGGQAQPRGPQTLTPKGGYAAADGRTPVPHILSARWEPLTEGRLLVVTALPTTQGWHDLALVTADPQVPGRVRPDADGVLNLVLVGNPPAAGTAEARRAARPQIDTVTAGMAISTQQLGRITRVIVNGRDNAVSLGN